MAQYDWTENKTEFLIKLRTKELQEYWILNDKEMPPFIKTLKQI